MLVRIHRLEDFVRQKYGRRGHEGPKGRRRRNGGGAGEGSRCLGGEDVMEDPLTYPERTHGMDKKVGPFGDIGGKGLS